MVQAVSALLVAGGYASVLPSDDKTADNVWNVMYDYVKANQITLIIVEHNIERAKLADRCFKLGRSKTAYSTLVEVEK